MSSFLIIVKNSSILMYTYATVIYVMLYVICYICYMLYVIYKILYCNCVKMCKVAQSINKVYLIWFDLIYIYHEAPYFWLAVPGQDPLLLSLLHGSTVVVNTQLVKLAAVSWGPQPWLCSTTREKKGDHSNKNIIVNFSQRISLYCPAEQNLQGTTEKTWVK